MDRHPFKSKLSNQSSADFMENEGMINMAKSYSQVLGVVGDIHVVASPIQSFCMGLE